MSLLELRRRALSAEQRLELESTRWRARADVLGAHYARHRAAWLWGGFGAGVIAGLLPLRAGARLGRAVVDGAMLLLRSPLTSLVLEQAQRHLGEAARKPQSTDAKSDAA